MDYQEYLKQKKIVHRSAGIDIDRATINPILFEFQKDLVVLSPFAGIGSEGYRALELGRRFVGIELKESYYRVAAANLRNATNKSEMLNLFNMPC